MTAIWYYKFAGDIQGPFTASELKQKATAGELGPDAWIRKTASGDWVTADGVTGLFDRKPIAAFADEPRNAPPMVEPPLEDWFADSGGPELTGAAGRASDCSTKRCPFCAEEIAEQAIKCKHCGEFLDHTLRNVARQENSFAQQKWSPGIAAVLSLVIPGAGQMYKGEVGNGLLWLISVCIGYALFMIPGIALHICCIFGAASGDPTKFA